MELFGRLGISDAYLNLSGLEYQDELIGRLSQEGISVYYLSGKAEWYQDAGAAFDMIDEIAEYNNNHDDHKVAGITLDIEPYTLSAYKENPISGFESYASTMESIYAYAREKGVRLVTSVPYWYDHYTTGSAYSEEEKERGRIAYEKVMQNTDRLSVMNYTKENMIGHITEEIEYAKEHSLEIESAADFTEHANATTESETSYFDHEDPLGTVHSVWKEIETEYDYDNLHFSYHHLGAIIKIDKRPKPAVAEEPSEPVTSAPVSEVQGGEMYNAPAAVGDIVDDGVFLYRVLDKKRVSCIGTVKADIKKAVIPAKARIRGSSFQVTEIGKGALRGGSFTTLVIGANVKSIGASAFRDCKKLKKITVTAGKLKKIGKNAFKGISKKARIKLKGTQKAKKSLKKRLVRKTTGYVKGWKIV